MHSSSPDSWLSLARFELPRIEHPVKHFSVPSFQMSSVMRFTMDLLGNRRSQAKYGRLSGCSAAEASSTAVWQHSQFEFEDCGKYSLKISRADGL